MKRINLKTLSRSGLDEWILSVGEKKFRAAQLWSWMYQKNETDFTRMTDLARDFRGKLEETAEAGTLVLENLRVSAASGTRKYLWRLEDGLRVESVFIPDGVRRTVCVSSQVGCAMGCTFCATGTMGFVRNLSAFEILEQFLGVWRDVGEKPTNIVVMGMGEPFLNYDAVIRAMTILNHQEGSAMGARKITLSTSGIVPQILRFAEEKQPFQLAISLNASSDAQRSEIMPVNRT
ncbi:MAG TPA: 23S rRNA (adenine(2503)-C(2))-methyltransferase RlmN, partial [bacterium]|nr:23S rRNA (adenine(2503)-C(2))-methyltransferase RlmN [bacterium]